MSTISDCCAGWHLSYVIRLRVMIRTPPNRWIFFLLLNLAWFGTGIGIQEQLQGQVHYYKNEDMLPVLRWLAGFCPVVNLFAALLLAGAKFPAPLNLDDCTHPYMDVFLTL